MFFLARPVITVCLMENEALIDSLARKICDYHRLNHTLQKSDCIMVLGSNDTRVAERGAELFLQGWAPLLIFSGNVGALTEGLYGRPEAEHFAELAINMGVPEECILVENRSTNTGENIQFTRELLNRLRFDPASFIVVQKPYMERRAYATFKQFWPEKRFIVTSPQIPFEAYPLPHMPKAKLISIVTGDLQRIKLYPEKGFQIPQEIPSDVWEAYEKLVSLGFTDHLVA
ncbi:MAG: YdcF family protein [Limisphaerales bacterium]